MNLYDYITECEYEYMMIDMDCYIEGIESKESTQEKKNIIIRIVDAIKSIIKKIIDKISDIISSIGTKIKGDVGIPKKVIKETEELDQYSKDLKGLIKNFKDNNKIKKFLDKHPNFTRAAKTAAITAAVTGGTIVVVNSEKFKKFNDKRRSIMKDLSTSLDMIKHKADYIEKEKYDQLNDAYERQNQWNSWKKSSDELEADLYRKKFHVANDQIDRLKNRITNLADEKDELERRLNNKQDEYDNMQKVVKDLSDKINYVQKDIAAFVFNNTNNPESNDVSSIDKLTQLHDYLSDKNSKDI